MPRFPVPGHAAKAMPESVFARLWPRLAGYAGEVFPFHLGDVHLPPAALPPPADPAFFAYGAPAGENPLLRAVEAKIARQNQLTGAVQITCGATHAFACATRALLDPGDDILLLAPYWRMGSRSPARANAPETARLASAPAPRPPRNATSTNANVRFVDPNASTNTRNQATWYPSAMNPDSA